MTDGSGDFEPSLSVPLKTNAAFQALPFVDPIAYGRSLAGTSSVAVSQASETTTYTAPAAASTRTRRQRVPAHAHEREQRETRKGHDGLEQLDVEGDPEDRGGSEQPRDPASLQAQHHEQERQRRSAPS